MDKMFFGGIGVLQEKVPQEENEENEELMLLLLTALRLFAGRLQRRLLPFCS